MRFRTIDDKKDIKLGGRYILAFEENNFVGQDGITRLCPDSYEIYMYVDFGMIAERDPEVLIEDDDKEYVGFSKPDHCYKDHEYRMIWKKVTGVAGYSLIPVIVWDKYLEKDE